MDFKDSLIYILLHRLERPKLKHLIQVSEVLNWRHGDSSEYFWNSVAVELWYELSQVHEKSDIQIFTKSTVFYF